MLDELTGKFGLPIDLSPESYRYSVYGKSGGLFEGVRTICAFSEDKIILCVKNGTLIVTGEKLAIKKYGEREIAVSGRIVGVELK